MKRPDARRLLVYTDYAYTRRAGGVYAERAFALFLSALADRIGGLTVLGRLRPSGGEARYRLGEQTEFRELPFYGSLADRRGAAGAIAGSLRAFWRALDDVERVWLFGPHPLALLFAGAALLRRREVVLGVRQDLPAYIASRRPGRRDLAVAARVLESAWRLAARRLPVVVVGPELAANYAAAPRLLEIAVSLVADADLVEPESRRLGRPPRTVLSVGRIDREKNPLLLADVLARLEAAEPGGWRLVVCGEGPMETDLAERLADLGVDRLAELRGYVGFGPELLDLYRSADLFLHVSWTEGFPQVLVEAAACATPIVATRVGGVAAAIGERALLIEPGDADAAASALRRLADDDGLRSGLVEAASRWASGLTLEATLERVAEFLAGPDQSRGSADTSRPNAT